MQNLNSPREAEEECRTQAEDTKRDNIADGLTRNFRKRNTPKRIDQQKVDDPRIDQQLRYIKMIV